jgi:hypothetical protein
MKMFETVSSAMVFTERWVLSVWLPGIIFASLARLRRALTSTVSQLDDAEKIIPHKGHKVSRRVVLLGSIVGFLSRDQVVIIYPLPGVRYAGALSVLCVYNLPRQLAVKDLFCHRRV